MHATIERHKRRWRAWAVATMACGLCTGAWRGHAQGEPRVSEEAVKAAFLFRFGDYVEWPAGTTTPGITIAILRAPEIAEELRRILAARDGQGARVTVREISRADELRDEQIVFVGRGHDVAIERLARRFPERAFLLVADSPGALERGAVINFVLNEQRVRFEVSLPAAQHAHLRLSSRLLAVAYRVERDDRPEN